MIFDPLQYNYASRRNVVYANNGMVATSQPLAAGAGLEVLKKGGNAIDAAIATAACLTVVEPTANGIGGDAFAIIWTRGKLHGLNASGTAPKGISAEAVRKAGYNEMPKYGWVPVTVPGVPSAWAALSERFGRLSMTEVLKPAIRYAYDGYPVSPTAADMWERAYTNYSKDLKGEEYKYWFETFTLDGKPPRPGDVWGSTDHAKTLESIAETKAESFYKGELAKKIDAYSKKYGGFLRKEDLADYKPEWVEPIGINYRGYDVWEIPPNGHGIVALIALNILKGFEFNEKDNIETYHRQIEAIKLAFADGKKYIADPRDMNITVEELLSEEYAAERRKLIKGEALIHMAGKPAKGGTVYLSAADGEGNMISYIQSNYMGFGSGLVVPGTGIALHNRGKNFSLEPGHDNCLAPGKKPYHTIIPGFLSKDGKPVGPFGVMGGFMQPQGHVQVIMNTIDFHMNPQDALDAPRWQWIQDRTVHIEHQFPNSIAQSLQRKGHDIKIQTDSTSFGRGQIIWRLNNGALIGGTEPRTDGTIAAW